MSQCPFLSTAEEKIGCFKECALYEYESTNDGCPFKRVKNKKTINIKDIITIDFTYDGENDNDFIERICSKNYFVDDIV